MTKSLFPARRAAVLAAMSVTLPAAAAPLVPQVHLEPREPDAVARIDGALEALMRFDLAPGMAVGVVRGDQVVLLRGLGVADVETGRAVTPDTVFYIASATKPFTGTAAAIADHRGDLALDATLAERLPTASWHDGIDPSAITIRDLLSHTHGIANHGPVTFRLAFSGEHTPALLRDLIRHHGPAEAGRTFDYGNLGYNLASMAMDDTLGRSWKDVLQRDLFDPLGMSSTTAYESRVRAARRAWPYRENPVGFSRLHDAKIDANMHAAGGLMTTARDLVRWLEVNLNGGRLDGRQVIPAAVLAEAHRAQADREADSFGPFGRAAYGLGWHLGVYDQETMLHHFGGFSGYHAHLSFLPERGIGVVVLTNTSGFGSVLAVGAASSIYDVMLERPDADERLATRLEQLTGRVAAMRERLDAERQRRAARPQDLPHPLEAYTGTYESPIMGRLTMTLAGGRLEATMGNLWSVVEVYDAEENALRVELTGGGTVLFFDVPEGAARADGFELRGFSFARIRDQPDPDTVTSAR